MRRAAPPAALMAAWASCLVAAPACSGADGASGRTFSEATEASQIRGRIVHESDIENVADNPYSEGFAFVIATEEWHSDGASRPDSLATRVDLAGDARVKVARLDRQGRFEFSLPPGAWTACVGDLGVPTAIKPAPWPMAVYGCIDLEIGHREVIELALSFGEGGFTSAVHR